jgi:holliday junction DNA helicase RuvA
MISYLKGILVGVQKVSTSKVLLVIEVAGIGYDVQVLPRILSTLPALNDPLQVFTHQQVREDGVTLFGFAIAAERDLFRQLISVSGIGPQLAIALLDTLGLQDLVQAIVTGNTRLLSRTPGVGAKTAERIALELKTKLAEWRQRSELAALPSSSPALNVQEDVEMTLMALGYTHTEIGSALQAVSQNSTLNKSADVEEWIRLAIAWLSQSI